MQSKVPTISVEPGFYMTNFKYFAPPQTNADGAMVWAFPCTPETLVPAIDIPSDYGAAVTKVCESPEKFVGKRFFIAGEYISLKKFGEDIAAALGKKAVVVQAPRETYVAGLSAHMGPVVAEELTQMYEYFQYFGYYGGEPLSMAELGLKGTSVESWAKTGAAAKLFA